MEESVGPQAQPSRAKLVIAVTAMVAAPLVFMTGVLGSVRLQDSAVMGLAGFFGFALLVALGSSGARSFIRGTGKHAGEPGWYIPLTPAYLRWAGTSLDWRPSWLMGVTWVAWAGPAAFWVFLAVHAILDFAGALD